MKDSALFDRIRFRGRPQAHPASMVVSGNVRFTVLTPRMIRLEWAETGAFEDRATYAFPTRYVETPPPFAVRVEDGVLVLDTGALTLCYRIGSGQFTPENLSIAFPLNGETVVWRPGMSNPRNLRGTRRTLDNCAGDATLEEGLLSRDGWALFDDTPHVLFDPADGWVQPRRDYEIPGKGVQDWIFFGYGHDYKAALSEYLPFGGAIPLIPRFILGGWWSRYWAYSDEDLKQLVGDFEAHDIPLDVLVIDMDWHTPDGWTGYTWNRALFPDPPAFLRWVHEKGLRATLNLHPADGIQPHEAAYPAFAQAMGVDPATRQPIPFTIGDKRFVEAYFSILHHPMEDEGVDFWWLDWQQGEVSDVKGLDPLPWLNHLHFNDITRKGVRPMLYSRWGGLGNHRYYIGFSGDTYETWGALAYQPYFTATAANVLYGWWSHDIGGHMGGTITPELYARWVQYGALSPVLRLHATKDARCERRPWAFGEDVFRVARTAFQWRYRLVPYLYTLARRNVETGLSVCYPMVYEHPEVLDAYAARFQYYFGDQMLAAPIVHPMDEATGMAFEDVWVPPGMWMDAQTHETFTGPRWVRLVGDLDRVPLLLKAGAIVPLAPEFEEVTPPRLRSGVTDVLPRDRLVIAAVPGAPGRFRLYEDDGLTEAYREGQFEWTEITSEAEGARWRVTIAPVEGRCDALPAARSYELWLEGSAEPVEVWVNGAPAVARYDAARLRTIISTPAWPKSQAVTVEARAAGDIVALGEAHNRACIAADVQRLLQGRAGALPLEQLLDADAVLALPELPGKWNAVARLGGPFARCIPFTTLEETSQQLVRIIVGAPADGSPYDVEVRFTLHRGPAPQGATVRHTQTTEAHILDAPFVFDGVLHAQQCEAEVTLTWRGVSWTERFVGPLLFPAIPRWRLVAFHEGEAPAPEAVFTADGGVDPTLDWRLSQQELASIPALDEPHAVHFVYFAREYEADLWAGTPLVGYLTTTVFSPQAREAVLEFRTGGSVTLFCNGVPLEVRPHPEAADAPLWSRPIERTAPFSLRAGMNTLLIRSTPAPDSPHPHWWFFGGRLATPEGAPLVDVDYR